MSPDVAVAAPPLVGCCPYSSLAPGCADHYLPRVHPSVALMLALAAALSPSASVSHVRSTDPRLIAQLADGCRRSPTMRALVETLDSSDLFVYVEAGRRGGGSVQLAESTPHGRYVRVSVDAGLDPSRLIAVIAHELRHAAEIAAAPEVVDRVSLEVLYERIGVRRTRCSDGSRCYETPAAEYTTAIVFKEICGRSVPPDGLRAHW